MKMMEMRLGAIGLDKESGESVVLLKEPNGRRALPIWVGLPEARAISFAVRNVTTARPLTHNLLYSTIKQLGYQIKHIAISGVKAETFLAEIVLFPSGRTSDETTVTLDARPSDAIALAIMADAPILVDPAILAEAGIAANPEAEEKEALEFKAFIEQVKASDFNQVGPTD